MIRLRKEFLACMVGLGGMHESMKTRQGAFVNSMLLITTNLMIGDVKSLTHHFSFLEQSHTALG